MHLHILKAVKSCPVFPYVCMVISYKNLHTYVFDTHTNILNISFYCF